MNLPLNLSLCTVDWTRWASLHLVVAAIIYPSTTSQSQIMQGDPDLKSAASRQKRPNKPEVKNTSRVHNSSGSTVSSTWKLMSWGNKINLQSLQRQSESPISEWPPGQYNGFQLRSNFPFRTELRNPRRTTMWQFEGNEDGWYGSRWEWFRGPVTWYLDPLKIWTPQSVYCWKIRTPIEVFGPQRHSPPKVVEVS